MGDVVPEGGQAYQEYEIFMNGLKKEFPRAFFEGKDSSGRRAMLVNEMGMQGSVGFFLGLTDRGVIQIQYDEAAFGTADRNPQGAIVVGKLPSAYDFVAGEVSRGRGHLGWIRVEELAEHSGTPFGLVAKVFSYSELSNYKDLRGIWEK